jgi:signal transduction histidine kinase/ActR/RegA family two-component response regulator
MKRIFNQRSSSIRSSLSWVLAGTLICGLCIAGYFSWSFTRLERLQHEVSGHSLALRELQNLGEQLDLLLVSSDLAIGAGETYAAQIAISLSRRLQETVQGIGSRPGLPYDLEPFGRISAFLADIEQQISAEDLLVSRNHDDDRSVLLKKFDATSGQMVQQYEQLLEAAQADTEQKSAFLSSLRASSPRHYTIALLCYFLGNVVLVLWCFRRIVWPLEALTHGVDAAMNGGNELISVAKGPREIDKLAKHFKRLVAQLEQKVTERTRALLEKTKTLENEVAERKMVQQALESAKEVAEKSSRVKSEFLSVMSHELRTPMNAVLGSLSLIRDSDITPEQKAYVEIADDSGKALVKLLGDILDLSKIESEKLTLKSDAFPVHEVVSTTVNMLQRRAIEKGLRVSAFVDPEVPAMLNGDFGRIRQILINFVDNAIKFTRRGHIDIGVSLDQPGDEMQVVRFSVTDSGIGLPKSDYEHIFDSFTQVDSSLSRDQPGVGLGLSICSRLAQAMGGKCGVESTRGVGSTFWFTVSLPTPEDAGDESHKSPVATRKPVLVVENGENHASGWAADLLRLHDIPHSIAADIKEAEERLNSAVAKGEPYACTIVATPDRDPNFIHALEQFASLTRSLDVRCIVFSDRKLTPTARAIEEWLVEEQSPCCAAQDDLVNKILGQDEKRVNKVTETDDASNARIVDRTEGSLTRILIVEDSEANRLIAAAILRKSGFIVEEASSGFEAIQKCQQHNFDAVLMDLQMSGMDGFEATRAIRRLPSNLSSTPIIAFSANAMEETMQKCVAAGMNDFISKPFVKETILEKIARWTSRPEDGQPTIFRSTC